MELLSPEQQQASFDENIITDLDQVPGEFLAQARADAERLIESREAQHSD